MPTSMQVHLHLETAKPTLLFLTETQISSPADSSYLHYHVYRFEHNFVPHAGVYMFIQEDICRRRIQGREDQDLSVIILYRSHGGNSDITRLFEHLQLMTDRLIEQVPSAELVVIGDFNAHHVEWLGSRSTDFAGRSAHEFALAHGFS